MASRGQSDQDDLWLSGADAEMSKTPDEDIHDLVPDLQVDQTPTIHRNNVFAKPKEPEDQKIPEFTRKSSSTVVRKLSYNFSPPSHLSLLLPILQTTVAQLRQVLPHVSGAERAEVVDLLSRALAEFRDARPAPPPSAGSEKFPTFLNLDSMYGPDAASEPDAGAARGLSSASDIDDEKGWISLKDKDARPPPFSPPPAAFDPEAAKRLLAEKQAKAEENRKNHRLERQRKATQVVSKVLQAKRRRTETSALVETRSQERQSKAALRRSEIIDEKRQKAGGTVNHAQDVSYLNQASHELRKRQLNDSLRQSRHSAKLRREEQLRQTAAKSSPSEAIQMAQKRREELERVKREDALEQTKKASDAQRLAEEKRQKNVQLLIERRTMAAQRQKAAAARLEQLREILRAKLSDKLQAGSERASSYVEEKRAVASAEVRRVAEVLQRREQYGEKGSKIASLDLLETQGATCAKLARRLMVSKRRGFAKQRSPSIPALSFSDDKQGRFQALSEALEELFPGTNYQNAKTFVDLVAKASSPVEFDQTDSDVEDVRERCGTLILSSFLVSCSNAIVEVEQNLHSLAPEEAEMAAVFAIESFALVGSIGIIQSKALKPSHIPKNAREIFALGPAALRVLFPILQLGTLGQGTLSVALAVLIAGLAAFPVPTPGITALLLNCLLAVFAAAAHRQGSDTPSVADKILVESPIQKVISHIIGEDVFQVGLVRARPVENFASVVAALHLADLFADTSARLGAGAKKASSLAAKIVFLLASVLLAPSCAEQDTQELSPMTARRVSKRGMLLEAPEAMTVVESAQSPQSPVLAQQVSPSIPCDLQTVVALAFRALTKLTGPLKRWVGAPGTDFDTHNMTLRHIIDAALTEGVLFSEDFITVAWCAVPPPLPPLPSQPEERAWVRKRPPALSKMSGVVVGRGQRSYTGTTLPRMGCSTAKKPKFPAKFLFERGMCGLMRLFPLAPPPIAPTAVSLLWGLSFIGQLFSFDVSTAIFFEGDYPTPFQMLSTGMPIDFFTEPELQSVLFPIILLALKRSRSADGPSTEVSKAVAKLLFSEMSPDILVEFLERSAAEGAPHLFWERELGIDRFVPDEPTRRSLVEFLQSGDFETTGPETAFATPHGSAPDEASDSAQ